MTSFSEMAVPERRPRMAVPSLVRLSGCGMGGKKESRVTYAFPLPFRFSVDGHEEREALRMLKRRRRPPRAAK